MNTRRDKILKAIFFIISVVLFFGGMNIISDARIMLNNKMLRSAPNAEYERQLLYGVFIVSISVSSIIFGVICEKICYEKARNENGFYYGYFLGVIGLIVAIALKDNKASSVEDNTKYDELEKLQKLKDAGTITDEEFKKEKEKILQ